MSLSIEGLYDEINRLNAENAELRRQLEERLYVEQGPTAWMVDQLRNRVTEARGGQQATCTCPADEERELRMISSWPLSMSAIYMARNKAIADELYAENRDLRRQLDDAKGEAQRTVYVQADDAKEAMIYVMDGGGFDRMQDAEHPAGATVFAVTLTARKVKSC